MLINLLALVYFGVTILLLLYSVQCYLMVGLFWKRYRLDTEQNALLLQRAETILAQHDYPSVTTQIPLYNELNVAERVIRAAAAIDYPNHEVQVLDDSEDETRLIVDRIAAELRATGKNVRVVRRGDRSGYKAGALKHGMTQTESKFLAIFDGDFVPPPDYLQRTIPFFLERETLGIVQARWAHLNDRKTLFTRAQSIGIDGHFMVEQCARAFNGLFMNFNGTAGVWRRQAIEDAGGWTADTLTEDIDLSYRAQLAGWQAHYLPDLGVPAELPEEVIAFKSQQFRWAKGSIQTAIKLLPRLIRSETRPLAKLVAFFHLTHYLIHPLMLLVGLLALPMLLWSPFKLTGITLVILAAVIVITMTAPNVVYITSQRALYKDWRSRLAFLPMVMCVGVGIALNNTKAVTEAVLGIRSGFIRTPKKGDAKLKRYAVGKRWESVLDIAVGIYCLASILVYFSVGNWIIGPFLAIYCIGFLMIGIRGLWEQRSIFPAVGLP